MGKRNTPRQPDHTQRTRRHEAGQKTPSGLTLSPGPGDREVTPPFMCVTVLQSSPSSSLGSYSGISDVSGPTHT
ncbi:hypothetical protein E2C01_010737 [Portunus trituberculatus]|uniref:Uncharacterized protein n=1 Tax=Portunus trituberculatus TaxID=210409 RepID=A0A5B7D983_PORTR|nr:hypothetical protein [Portunus trituberculatus]